MDNQHKKPLDLAAMNAKLAEARGPQYWRSLEELAETPEFQQILEDEFPQQSRPLRMPVDRRQFLTLAGASLALAGLSGCRFIPQKKIVPYVDKPEDMEYSVPLYYATAVSLSGIATGVLVTSREGRPIKIEGNPDHPASLGAVDAITQASLLTLYDPDRSQSVLRLGQVSSWDAFLAEARKALSSISGNNLRILTETVTSPTLAAQIKTLIARFPGAKWHQYEPCGRDNAQQGAQMAFGSPVNTIYHFDKADRILSLDGDFLLSMPGNLRYSRDFINRRRVRSKDVAGANSARWTQPANESMNRLYVIESTTTITGAMADHRLPVRASQVEAVARVIAQKLNAVTGSAALPAGVPETWIDELVKDLSDHKGKSIVVTGDHQPPAVHALVHAINAALGDAGQPAESRPITYTDPVEAQPEIQMESLKSLVADIKGGQVKMLLILGGNPVYNAPSDLDFGGVLNSVPLRVHLSQFDNETSARCHWHLPETHSLEAWSDGRAYDGTVSIIQPLIAPLFADCKSAHELLSALTPAAQTASAAADAGEGAKGLELGPMQSGYDIVHGFWRSQNSASNSALWSELNNRNEMDFEKLFQQALHDGLLRGSALPAKTVTASAANVPPAANAAQGSEILFLPDPTVHDGRYSNNGWLQELPKPITKLTWDNAALMSPQTAINLKLAPQGSPEDADEKMVKLTVGNSSVTAAVLVVPGLPDDCITLTLGYGRERAGKLGNGIGFNAYALRTSDNLHFATGAKLEAADGIYTLAHTRHAHSIESSEHVMIEVLGLDGFQKVKDKPWHRNDPEESTAHNKDLTSHNELRSETEEKPETTEEKDTINPRTDESLYGDAQVTDHKYEGFGAYAWAMSIDNNACIGCSACVTACQSENNIPIVGKDQIRRGRDMLWIRIDTYFRGPISNPQSFFEPVPCMHCELAPCEPVCPVAATVHSHEGLNMQIYNRCVGTKYCSNNCPYKVRRFNFYKYVAGQPEPDKITANYDNPIIKLSANPEVTIRGRGIMEKCTYCVQRINSARIDAKKDRREIKDGEILTACQSACPTNAIVFGNINDKKSLVSQLKSEPHDYTLLADLNTRPRTTYLARLRNPNPAIPEPGDAAQSAKKTE